MRFGGVVAADGATVQIARGAIAGLIGPNGAGKTTMFNIAAGALSPNSGRILFDGVDVTGEPPHKRFRRGLARTFQIPRPFAKLTVLENRMAAPLNQTGEGALRAWTQWRRIAGEERRIRARADELLDFLKLSPLRDAPSSSLSGGQKKLLELGRALMAEPRMILLDEPGAGVNPTLMGELIDVIRKLNEDHGVTFCVIEHDMDVIAALCEPVIAMARGRVLIEGSFSEVRADPRVQDAYLGGADP